MLFTEWPQHFQFCILIFSLKQPGSNVMFHRVHHFGNPDWCSVAPGRRPAILIQVHSLEFSRKVMLLKGNYTTSYFCSSQKGFHQDPYYRVAYCSFSSHLLALSANTSFAHDVFSWFNLCPHNELEIQIWMLLFLITLSAPAAKELWI